MKWYSSSDGVATFFLLSFPEFSYHSFFHSTVVMVEIVFDLVENASIDNWFYFCYEVFIQRETRFAIRNSVVFTYTNGFESCNSFFYSKNIQRSSTYNVLTAKSKLFLKWRWLWNFSSRFATFIWTSFSSQEFFFREIYFNLNKNVYPSGLKSKCFWKSINWKCSWIDWWSKWETCNVNEALFPFTRTWNH